MELLREIGHPDVEPARDPDLAKRALVAYQRDKKFGKTGYYGKDVLRTMIADYYAANESVPALSLEINGNTPGAE